MLSLWLLDYGDTADCTPQIYMVTSERDEFFRCESANQEMLASLYHADDGAAVKTPGTETEMRGRAALRLRPDACNIRQPQLFRSYAPMTGGKCKLTGLSFIVCRVG